MARPKAFDRDTALQGAIGVFTQHGYEGTSTEALLSAMGISRQSLYDTFGDKRRLYLEALQRYNTESVLDILASAKGDTPLDRMEAALLAFAARPQTETGQGCMGVMAVCEFGRTDPEVTRLSEASGHVLQTALERLVEDAKAAGQTPPDLDTKTAARFVATTLSGMKVAARAGAPPADLAAIVRIAIRSLK